MTTPNHQEILRAKVNLETSRIAWRELQRFFASGAAISVANELDLVEVALQISEDNKAQVEQWLASGPIGKGGGDQPLRAVAGGGLIFAHFPLNSHFTMWNAVKGTSKGRL